MEISAIQLVRAVSQLTHSSASAFDIDLPLTGTPSVECRNSNSNFTLVLTFRNEIPLSPKSVLHGTVVSLPISNSNRKSTLLVTTRNSSP